MKVLLADDDAERAGTVARVLATNPGVTVLRLKPGGSLAGVVTALALDVILGDMARPDRNALVFQLVPQRFQREIGVMTAWWA